MRLERSEEKKIFSRVRDFQECRIYPTSPGNHHRREPRKLNEAYFQSHPYVGINCKVHC